MEFILSLQDKPHIIALQSLTDTYNKLRDEKEQVSMEGYLQEVLNGMVYSAAITYNTDVIEIDKQIADLQAKRAEVVAASK